MFLGKRWQGLCLGLLVSGAMIAAFALPAAAHADASPPRALLDAGYQSTCLEAHNLVRCWGGAMTTPIVPGIATDVPITSLSVGHHLACVVQSGRVSCWGLSSTIDAIAKEVPGITTAVQVAAGGGFACARLESGAVVCWGSGGYGTLGNGSTQASETPVSVLGITDAIAIDANYAGACVVRRDGTAWCWGAASSGYLGDGKNGPIAQPVPQRVGTTATPVTDAVGVSVGRLASCVTRVTGGVQCWGYNDGYLGTSSSRPIVTVAGLADITTLTAGLSFQCASVTEGVPQCWGNNAKGQLGDGTTNSRAIPSPVTKLKGVTTVTTGYDHACALALNGVWCWGSNATSQVPGAPTGGFTSTPIRIPDSQDWLDARIPTQGPFREISTTHDLRCGRDPKIDDLFPLLADYSCGTWIADGDNLFGPESERMDKAWPTTIPWIPLSQKSAGAGTTEKPYEITTVVTNGSLVVQQVDSYVNGAAKTVTNIKVTNATEFDKNITVYVAGDCMHNPGGGEKTSLGFGFLSSADILTGAGTGCRDKDDLGQVLSWESQGQHPAITANTPAKIGAQIGARQAFDGKCECGTTAKIDDAAGLSWSASIPSAGAKTFTYDLVLGTGPPKPVPLPPTPELPPGVDPLEIPWNIRDIGAPKAWAAKPVALTGAGQTIAVVDTGVDVDSPWFRGSTVSDGGCWTTDFPKGAKDRTRLLAGTCRGTKTTTVQDGDHQSEYESEYYLAGHTAGSSAAKPYGVTCGSPVGFILVTCAKDSSAGAWRFYQGSVVGGVAAGRDGANSVAPGAKILGANVASVRRGITKEEESIVANPSDVAEALQWIDKKRRSTKIAAVNLLLPGRMYNADTSGYSTGACQGKSPYLERAIHSLVSHNISVVVAAGDASRKSQLPFPACLPDVISVGSYRPNHTVIQNSNSSNQLTMLAPGQNIKGPTRAPGLALSGMTYSWDFFSGTYLAAAHVTGAIALFKQKFPTATESRVRAALTQVENTGSKDSNGLTRPRLRIDKALGIGGS